MSLNLLRTAPTGIGRFRKKYIHDGASSETDRMFFTCEYNRIIYTLTERIIANLRYYHINSIGITSNEVRYLGMIPHTSFTSIGVGVNSTIGSFLCDGKNIYITYNGNMNLFKIDVETMTLLDIQKFTSDKTFNAYSTMQWYDTHTIALLDVRGLVLFDTDTNEFSYIRYKSSDVSNRISFAFSDKYIVDTNTNFAYYNRETQTFNTINLPMSSYNSEVVYGDGKFYVINQAYIFIFDEETGAWEEEYYPIPFGNKIKCATYTDGLIYILPIKSAKCWVFDVNAHMYSYMFLPWTFANNTDDTLRYSVASFKQYLFFQYFTFACINFNGLYKYRVGYKIVQYQIMCNSNTEYLSKDRCLVFNQGYLTLENVPELKPFSPISETTLKTVHISKNDYKNIYEIKVL